MVKWRGRRRSDNVEDRRGARPSAGGVGSGAIVMLLRLVLSRFGMRGVLVLGVVAVGLFMVGVNPVSLLQQGAPGPQQSAAPVDDETAQFIGVALAETEDVWGEIFSSQGASYEEPPLVMFSGGVTSACGYASAAAGPFYCPGDRKVYLDASFFQELASRFGAPGDFASVYVIAHEVGHHVQTITGISEKVRSAQRRTDEAGSNALQVRMELQADCYAGVFANRADRMSNYLDEGDIEEGLQAAAAIGDDTLQRNAGRRVTPESFTHGTSAQRMRWFEKGYNEGDPSVCDTFSASTL